MKAWLAYAGVGLVAVAALAGLAPVLVPSGAVGAVWFAAALAWVLQLIAFAGLVAVRERSELFLAGWLGGLVLRFGVVGLVAYWLSRSGVLPLAPALVSLVGFVFVLLLMEPLFLRRGLQTR
ncbi:MAG TPA: hypothetical protein VHG09_06635 [Longimicrobiales bacterium]|nr:hypothetical protein [Longimicrobiales bacterium]